MTTATKERPIMFSPESVRAILKGRKTQTRRILHNAPPSHVASVRVGDGLNQGEFGVWFNCRGPQSLPASEHNYSKFIHFRYGVPGDRLWMKSRFTVRYDEKFNETHWTAEGMWVTTHGRARGKDDTPIDDGQKSPLYMPYWLATERWPLLEITGVRAERLQRLSEDDALADGGWEYRSCPVHKCPIRSFSERWDSLNAKRGYPWESNPWVWVIEFRPVSECS